MVSELPNWELDHMHQAMKLKTRRVLRDVSYLDLKKLLMLKG